MAVVHPTPAVRFDADAAEDAARELLATAESIFEALAVLDNDRQTVTEDWQGHFRDTFDHEILRSLAGGQHLANLLQQMASVVRARAWQAQAAQRAHELSEED